MVAKRLKKKLVLIWRPDLHLNATFYDLFAPSREFEVTQVDDVQNRCGGQKVLRIDVSKTWRSIPSFAFHIHVISSGHLKLENSGPGDNKLFVDALTDLVPVKEVQARLSERLSVLGNMSDYVGVHMRNFLSLASDVPGLNDPILESIAAKERLKCHAIHFAHHIQRVKYHEPDSRFFVTGDDCNSLAKLQKIIGGNAPMVFSEPCQRSRSKESVRIALTDLLLLSMTRRLLISSWSSFSEIVVARGRFKPGQSEVACI